MRIAAVVALFSDVAEPELTMWVERGWVRPDLGDTGLVFHEIDVARVRLIRDLRGAMGIEDDTISLVLSLLDQVYELRGGLRSVMRAVEAQPEAVRAAVLAAMQP